MTSDPAYGDENRTKLGLEMSDFPVCKYNNSDCLSDLHWYWSYDFGNCFQFNVGLNSTNQEIDLRDSSQEGPTNGLQLEIWPLVLNNTWTSFQYDFGIVVFVHNSSFRPTISDAVMIKPGEVSYINIKRTYISNVQSPYTECIDLTSYRSDLFDFIVNSSLYSTYRQKDCFDLCKQQSIIKNCGCYHTGFCNPSHNLNVRPCLNLTDYDCYTSRFYAFDPVDCASKSCPLECESVQYELMLSNHIYPHYSYYPVSNETFSATSYEAWRTQFLKLYVYYNTLSYTQISVVPAMSSVDLITNIGGTLSLIVSMSLFSFIEMFEVLFLIVYALLFKK